MSVPITIKRVLFDDETVFQTYSMPNGYLIITDVRIVAQVKIETFGKQYNYYSFPFSSMEFSAIKTNDLEQGGTIAIIFINKFALTLNFAKHIDIFKVYKWISKHIL